MKGFEGEKKFIVDPEGVAKEESLTDKEKEALKLKILSSNEKRIIGLNEEGKLTLRNSIGEIEVKALTDKDKEKFGIKI